MWIWGGGREVGGGLNSGVWETDGIGSMMESQYVMYHLMLLIKPSVAGYLTEGGCLCYSIYTGLVLGFKMTCPKTVRLVTIS